MAWLVLGLSAHPASGKQTDGDRLAGQAAPSRPARTDLFISGVYPHLTTYGIYSQNGGHFKPGHNECGIGAVVPWAGRLWMVNYAPHRPQGSEHKLYSVDPDLTQPLKIHPESVGGTPAGRMIHAESQQLLIAHYLIDAQGNVRVISPQQMPIRVTAIARHLTDPANRVYYIDMEGSIWEANVHTLAVQRLFKKPVPGWHAKGGYTAQGRLVVSNNGELHVGTYDDLLVGGAAQTDEERGVLAEYDGTNWKIVERRQYTEVTGPRGIAGGSQGDEPLWAIGWDRRSLRLKVLDQGQWQTYRLPKAAYCNDASHGWYTEWPRIRQVPQGKWMMDMHGMFYDFPPTFSAGNSAGIRPIGSHLRYVPDFCDWEGRLVLASDETSIQENRLAGQPQSNLWFGTMEELREWGPASAYGGPWVEDRVVGGVPSEPFLIAGFDRRILHLVTGQRRQSSEPLMRVADQQPITRLPARLAELPRVSIPRGDWHQPAPGFEFDVDRPVTVYLAVDQRGQPTLEAAWQRTDDTLSWGDGNTDRIYRREFPAGRVKIPGNPTEHRPGAFGMPHAAFVESLAGDGAVPPIAIQGNALVAAASLPATDETEANLPVTFQIQVDRQGNGQWTDVDTLELAARDDESWVLPESLRAEWLRLIPSRDCVATAFLHLTTSRFADGERADNRQLFAGLADVDNGDARGARVYAAKRNRNLRMMTEDGRFYEFTKDHFEFVPDLADPELDALLKVNPLFTVDEASVVLRDRGRRWRLPLGDPGFDPQQDAFPARALREVESERMLANIHGTFYEVPLETNGQPPLWNRMRPVSSHRKRISDFCSWNGLLVLAGVKEGASEDGHVFASAEHGVGLWFGGIDDLWKLGKPVGRGGPWSGTKTHAGVPSDPYLMLGYDHKSVQLSHDSDQPVTLTVQVDLDGNGLWVDYRSFVVEPGEVAQHTFPQVFSAWWIRAVSDRDCQATVQLEYR